MIYFLRNGYVFFTTADGETVRMPLPVLAERSAEPQNAISQTDYLAVVHTLQHILDTRKVGVSEDWLIIHSELYRQPGFIHTLRSACTGLQALYPDIEAVITWAGFGAGDYKLAEVAIDQTIMYDISYTGQTYTITDRKVLGNEVLLEMMYKKLKELCQPGIERDFLISRLFDYDNMLEFKEHLRRHGISDSVVNDMNFSLHCAFKDLFTRNCSFGDFFAALRTVFHCFVRDRIQPSRPIILKSVLTGYFVSDHHLPEISGHIVAMAPEPLILRGMVMPANTEAVAPSEGKADGYWQLIEPQRPSLSAFFGGNEFLLSPASLQQQLSADSYEAGGLTLCKILVATEMDICRNIEVNISSLSGQHYYLSIPDWL